MIIVGLILIVLLVLPWFILPQKKLAEDKKVKTSVLLMTFLTGFTLTTFCIMIPEMVFDHFAGFDTQNPATVLQCFVDAFLRAALIEETVKMLFVCLTYKKRKPSYRIQYMLLAGMIGFGYAVIEKLLYGGNIALMLVNAVFPLHVFFQFIMGTNLYDAVQLKESDPSASRKAVAKAFLIPFALHGLWDFLLNVIGIPGVNDFVMMAGFILMIAGAIAGMVYLVRYLKKVCAEA